MSLKPPIKSLRRGFATTASVVAVTLILCFCLRSSLPITWPPSSSSSDASILKPVSSQTAPLHSLLSFLNENYTSTRPPSVHSTGELEVALDATHPGCPVPRAALIGILTTPGLENSVRRAYLRTKYKELMEGVQEEFKVDVRYFFGTSDKLETRYQLNLEKSQNPGDTVITTRIEHRDEGKILDWFTYARSQLYSPHPTLEGKFCKRYLFVGKTDDDSVVHLGKLGRLLVNIVNTSKSATHFVGDMFYDQIGKKRTWIKGMHGMLYLMTADLVEWIVHSKVPQENLKGIEDQQVGYWLMLSNIKIDWFDVGLKRFHDLMNVNPITNTFQNEITQETIVVHYCKTLEAFFKCMAGLFEEIGPKHPLLEPTAAQTRLKQQGLFLPLTHLSETLAYIQSNKTTLLLAEFDHHLLYHPLLTHSHRLGLPITVEDMNSMMHALQTNGSHGTSLDPLQLDPFIANHIIGAYARRMGLLEGDVNLDEVYDDVMQSVAQRESEAQMESQGGGGGGGGSAPKIMSGEELDLLIVVSSLKKAVGVSMMPKKNVSAKVLIEGFVGKVKALGFSLQQINMTACLKEYVVMEMGVTESEEDFMGFVLRDAILKVSPRLGIVAEKDSDLIEYAATVMKQFAPFKDFEDEILEFFVAQASFGVGIELSDEELVRRRNYVADLLRRFGYLKVGDLDVITVSFKVYERVSLMQWTLFRAEEMENMAKELREVGRTRKLEDAYIDSFLVHKIVDGRAKTLGVKLTKTKKKLVMSRISKERKGWKEAWRKLDGWIHS
ncbi:hypothetical protein HDU79_003974 [Rhizoclosmatium sp. JEL0117]|nr:hypothetical protein HDU79_003974 [Rhizoclosmatium sp. JEL0117]